MSEAKSKQEKKLTPLQMLMRVYEPFNLDLNKLEAIAELVGERNEVFNQTIGLSMILYDLYKTYGDYMEELRKAIDELREAKKGAA